MKVIKAPNNIYEKDSYSTTVFLAGSIEMGQCENWQAKTERLLSDYADCELTIYNPRRDDYNADAEQTIENAYFSEQVNWELNTQDEANYIFMYFHPDTKAPITLLELGLFADQICKLIVCCPNGFWRQGNVEIVCERFDIPFFRDYDEALQHLRETIDFDQQIIRDV
jgi:hypothetical protein